MLSVVDVKHREEEDCEVCVIIILSIGNTQVSILLLCFLYLFVELMITMNEYNFV